MIFEEIHEVATHIYQVKIPLPFSLKWVNSYIILEEDTYKIIDPGLKTEESIARWEQVLTLLDLKWSQCSAILLTHHHPDHYGLSGYIQQLSGAPVYMTKVANQYAETLWGSGKEVYEQQMILLLKQHGAPEEIQVAILTHLKEFEQRVKPIPDISWYHPYDEIVLAGKVWQLIPTVGHAYGQVMFYDKENHIIICGDQVLPKITPHVGVFPAEERPVLFEFIQNLQELATYEVTLALPGHREPFSNFSERALQIVAHHERRLDKLSQYIEEVGEANAFQCCEWLFGAHLRNNAHNMRFALTETIAHLEELVRRNVLRQAIHEQIIIYKH